MYIYGMIKYYTSLLNDILYLNWIFSVPVPYFASIAVQ